MRHLEAYLWRNMVKPHGSPRFQGVVEERSDSVKDGVSSPCRPCLSVASDSILVAQELEKPEGTPSFQVGEFAAKILMVVWRAMHLYGQ